MGKIDPGITSATIKLARSISKKLQSKEDKKALNKFYQPKKKLGYIQLTDIKK